jgi:NADH-quinone oxidoreductase subunit N
MMLMAAATDLLVIFLALEVLSIAVHVLTDSPRPPASTEAAFTYFLLGASRAHFFYTASRSSTA